MASALTLPLEAGFRAAVGVRNSLYDRGLLQVKRAALPVISVGNISVGGTGKTPFVAWLASVLRQWGHRPAVVLRGYGDDEIAVHRELNPEVPLIASARRSDGVAKARQEGCDCALLDDGFQHRALARDLDLVLVAAEQWTQNPRLLPRGPWREGFGALRRADFVVVTRKSASAAAALELVEEIDSRGFQQRVALAELRPRGLFALDGSAAAWEPSGKQVLAVSTLAEPSPFRRQLEELGAEVEALEFPDHHAFSVEDLERIVNDASGRSVVMTRKEAVKLRGVWPSGVEAWVLDQEVRVTEGRDALENALRKAMGTSR